jgi:hypothetical protein
MREQDMDGAGKLRQVMTYRMVIGGYDVLQKHLGKPMPDPDETTYTPVLVVFAVAARALGV